MKLYRLRRHAGALVAVALLWALGGAVALTLAPVGGLTLPAVAATPQAKGKAGDMPAGKAADNPCNPKASGQAADNPCNPKANGKAGDMPAGKAADNMPASQAKGESGAAPAGQATDNPCNPNAGGKAGGVPAGQATDNPCNATGAAAISFSSGNGAKLTWGEGFRAWQPVTGYVRSASHGNRLTVTYVNPPGAARIYKRNAELARLRRSDGLKPYPVGTVIAQASWLPNENGGAGQPGPLFFMRKEQPGYDPSGDDWRYAFTRQDFTVIGEGHGGPMAFCKDCHASVKARDFVFAIRR